MHPSPDSALRRLILTQEQFDTLREYAVGDTRTPGHDALCERIWSKTRVRSGVPIATLGPDDSALLRALADRECACGCQSLFRTILTQQPGGAAA